MKWTNPIKEKLKRGESVAGCWLLCPSPHTAELISQAGFDWALIDLEHGPITVERCAELAMALRGSETVPLARVPLNRPEYFKQVLDAGVWGVLVPMVNTAAEAREAVSASHYPPFGMRGRAKSRNVISAGVSSDDYLRDAIDAVLVAVQIETPEAVENINEIAGVEGVDLVFIGPNDLSATVGAAKGSSELESMIESVFRASQRQGKPVGIYCSDAKEANMRLAQGFQFVGCASDMGFMDKAARQTVADLWRRDGISRNRDAVKCAEPAPQRGFPSFASRYSEPSG